jgi:hypothetical protein
MGDDRKVSKVFWESLKERDHVDDGGVMGGLDENGS